MFDDFVFITRPKKHQTEANFTDFTPILKWLEDYYLFKNEHLCESPNVHIFLDKEALQDLKKTLDRLTPENCEDAFGYHEWDKRVCSLDDDSDESPYDDIYWQQVEDIKAMVNRLL